MYYELLENIAQTSRLRTVSPAIKLLLGLGCILIAISSPNPIIPLIIAISITFVTILIGGTSVKFYLRLLLIPAGFAMMSVAVIILVCSSGEVIVTCPVGDQMRLTITTGGLTQGGLILSRALAGICSLFFISLTTPITESFYLSHKIHIPQSLIDITMLVYRCIFIILEQAGQTHAAQVMRLGYRHPKEAISSFGTLAGALFINSWETGECLNRAMDCRCYDGKFPVLERPAGFSYSAFILTLGFLALMMALSIWIGETTGMGGFYFR